MRDMTRGSTAPLMAMWSALCIAFCQPYSPALAQESGRLETLIRGVESRTALAPELRLLVTKKEFLPAHEVRRYKRTVKLLGDPERLGFHYDELTDRSLSVMHLHRTRSWWRLEVLTPVLCGVNVWELSRQGRRLPRAVNYHKLLASNGREVARWECGSDNAVARESYSREHTGAFNYLQTRLIQTGLFRADYLRSVGFAARARVVGREKAGGSDCWVMQSKATVATRPSNPNCYARLWVAPERAFAVVRWEEFELVKGAKAEDANARAVGVAPPWAVQVNYVYAASDFREVRPGFWVPWRVIDQSASPDEETRTTQMRTRILEVKEFCVGESAPPVLRLMPLGTQVNDFVEKRGYVNGWDEGEIDGFLTEPPPEPQRLRPLATLTGDHAPTEP